MKESTKNIFELLGSIAIIIGVALLFILYPVVVFWLAWTGGFILKVFVGEFIASGLNLMFNTTRFTSDFIPLACGILATIGRYFRFSHASIYDKCIKNAKKEDKVNK